MKAASILTLTVLIMAVLAVAIAPWLPAIPEQEDPHGRDVY